MAKKKSFEDSILELEKIVENLESNNLPIEDAIKAYEKSQLLIKECELILNSAEKKIKKLVKNPDTAGGTEQLEII